ncbi:MAG: hypothetical protein JO086_16555 [Acidimicrobiia bacterium]|nr:hypothetical protein [Acidimicrobiia bacterium]
MISEDRREPVDVDAVNGEGAADPVLAALREMASALDDLARTADDMTNHADALAALRREGRSWEDLLFTDEARRLTTLLADGAEGVGRANSSVRRAQAAVLYGSGLSMEKIGNLLGISRQRVAILLKAAYG